MFANHSVRLALLGAGTVVVAVLTGWLISITLAPISAPAMFLTPAPPADLPMGSPRVPSPTVTDPPTADLPATIPPAVDTPVKATRIPTGRTSPAGRAPTSSPTTRPALTATLAVTGSWADGYVAEIRVTNAGTNALPWTVTVANAGRLNISLTNSWNATVTLDGGTVVLRGAPLAPGLVIAAGYQVSATAGSNPRPLSCTLTGGTCRRI